MHAHPRPVLSWTTRRRRSWARIADELAAGVFVGAMVLWALWLLLGPAR